MQTHHGIAWGLAALMALGLTLPGRTDKPTFANPGRDDAMNLRITVTESDEKDDTRAFQAWYGRQMTDYNRIDPETGERLADLLQMVTEVSDGKLMVTDDSSLRRGIVVTPRTRIRREDGYRDDRYRNDRWNNAWRKPTTDPRGRLTELIRPGDLIVAEGYLRAGGGITATIIRIVGHTRYYDDDRYPRQHGYAFRSWGEVRAIDTRRDALIVKTDTGTCTVTTDRNTDILYGRRQVALDDIERGDRVVFYSRDNDRDGSVAAFRIVVLGDRDAYPTGDRPSTYDPDYRDYPDGVPAGPVLEGRVQGVETGVFFNKMTLRGMNGQEYILRFSKSTQVIDRNGDRVSPLNLRRNERLRVFYTDIAGILFADRMEIE